MNKQRFFSCAKKFISSIAQTFGLHKSSSAKISKRMFDDYYNKLMKGKSDTYKDQMRAPYQTFFLKELYKVGVPIEIILDYCGAYGDEILYKAFRLDCECFSSLASEDQERIFHNADDLGFDKCYLFEKMKKPSEEIVKEAIKDSPFVIQRINNPSRELLALALRQCGSVIQCIDSPDSELIEIALLSDPDSIQFLKQATDDTWLLFAKIHPSCLGERTKKNRIGIENPGPEFFFHEPNWAAYHEYITSSDSWQDNKRRREGFFDVVKHLMDEDRLDEELIDGDGVTIRTFMEDILENLILKNKHNQRFEVYRDKLYSVRIEDSAEDQKIDPGFSL